MQLSDEELQLLDRYLDNDLNDAESLGLEARLKNDSAMADRLRRLREDRAMRIQAISSFEASDLESQQLQWRLRGALAQQQHSTPMPAGRVQGWMSGLSRVAAVLVFGMVVGYFYRGENSPIQPRVAQQTANPAPIDLTENGPATFLPGRNVAGLGGGVTPVANTVGQPTSFEVSLTDQNGKVVATQRFATLQEARDFANDMNRLQQKQRQVQNSGVRLIGDDF